MDPTEFLNLFTIEGGKVAVAIRRVTDVSYVPPWPEISAPEDVFFAPAVRARNGDTKEDVLGSRALWVDVDAVKQMPQFTMPPSYIVRSGGGWHCYWMLKEPLMDVDKIEELNKVLSRDVPTADKACWNANRFLRVPGTSNTKYEPPVTVALVREYGYKYDVSAFEVLGKLDPKTRHKIRTGDRRGYHSRSERDWAVIIDMVEAGAVDELIRFIFEHQPIGDKLRDPTTNPQYLDTSISKARSREPAAKSGGIEERSDGYYRHGPRGARRISTFTFSPRLLLDASRFSEPDAIMGDVTAAGYTWERVTFSRTAFTGLARLDRECPIAAWQWLGRDEDVRALLPFLMEKLQGMGMPRVVATPSLGLHYVDGWYFVGDLHTLSHNEMWEGSSGPVAALPTGRERCSLDLSRETSKSDILKVASLIPELNIDTVIWPLTGWYFATPLKPWIELHNYRFPVLNVYGTKGSGKTTLIQRVFMPMLGQVSPKSYDAGTTRFVTLALMGGTNAVPVAFSEFRYASVANFIRYILLSYDTGHDPRGRADQTTVDYPLSAPFSIDGEDKIGDPAAQERIVCVSMSPVDVREGGHCHRVFEQWQANPLNIGRFYIQSVLEMLHNNELEEMLACAYDASHKTIPGRMPIRIRNNHVVAYFGALLFCKTFGIVAPSFDVMMASIKNVFNIASGKARTLGDDFVEDIVNECVNNGGMYIRWHKDASTGQIWFQLSSAHSWWLSQMRRQSKYGLERDAVRGQLRELSYIIAPRTVDGALMFGVDIRAAQEAGLDVPLMKEAK